MNLIIWVICLYNSYHLIVWVKCLYNSYHLIIWVRCLYNSCHLIIWVICLYNLYNKFKVQVIFLLLLLRLHSDWWSAACNNNIVASHCTQVAGILMFSRIFRSESSSTTHFVRGSVCLFVCLSVCLYVCNILTLLPFSPLPFPPHPSIPSDRPCLFVNLFTKIFPLRKKKV